MPTYRSLGLAPALALATALGLATASGCSGPASGAGDMGSAADLRPVHRVFVTRMNYSGNFGGLRGGDSACSSAAGISGLGGAWVAWLSDSTHNAIDRVRNDVGPWVRLDGARVFDNKAQMMTLPQAPIDLDELHETLHVTDVWTGTAVGGTATPGGISADCQDWQDDGMNGAPPIPRAHAGNTDFKDMKWTDNGPIACNSRANLFCIEQ